MEWYDLPRRYSDGQVAVALFQLAYDLDHRASEAARYGVVHRRTRMMLIARALHRCAEAMLDIKPAGSARLLEDADEALAEYVRLYPSDDLFARRYREAIHAVMERRTAR